MKIENPCIKETKIRRLQMQQLGQQPVLQQGQRLVQQKVIQSQPQHSSLRDSGGGDGEGQAQQQPLQRGGLSQRHSGGEDVGDGGEMRGPQQQQQQQ